MLKNIIFDLGGIIVGLNPKQSIAAFREIGASDVASYIEDHRTEDLFLDIEVGRKTTAEFCNEVRTIAQCQATDAQIEAAWNSLIKPMPLHKVQMLEQLSTHYQLFLLSNTNEMHWNHCQRLCQEAAGRRLDSYFKRCFLSYEMGMAKPSHEIFAQVVAQAGIVASETLFVDDTKVNCQAAEAVGLHSLHDPLGTLWTTKL